MSNKYFDGVVRSTGVTADVDADLKAVVTGTKAKVQEKMDKLRVADAITAVFDLFRRCNKYIDETTPSRSAQAYCTASFRKQQRRL